MTEPKFALYLAKLDRNLDSRLVTDGLFENPTDPGPGLTTEDLLAFLRRLQVWLPQETTKKGAAKDTEQVGKRLEAMKIIEAFVTDSEQQSVFANVGKNIFAFQLALRARSPRKIDQGNTTLCGPAALVYDMAKRDPVSYVRFAISLVSTGTGPFGAALVTASAKIRRGYRVGLPPEADYVVLASVRETDAILISTSFVRDILTLTKPAALYEFLKRAGYGDIRDHTFLNLSMPLKFLNAATPFDLHAPGHDPIDRGLANLHMAAGELQNQRLVVMLADINLAAAMKLGTGLTALAKPLSGGDTHWTTIRKLKITNDKVLIKIITSGGSCERTLDRDALLSRYAGFMSASP
jgi:hypothetical protein